MRVIKLVVVFLTVFFMCFCTTLLLDIEWFARVWIRELLVGALVFFEFAIGVFWMREMVREV